MKRNPQIEAMRARLGTYFAREPDERLWASLRRSIEDPLKPRTKNGGFRINPILLLLIVLGAFSVGTFLCLSVLQP